MVRPKSGNSQDMSCLSQVKFMAGQINVMSVSGLDNVRSRSKSGHGELRLRSRSC